LTQGTACPGDNNADHERFHKYDEILLPENDRGFFDDSGTNARKKLERELKLFGDFGLNLDESEQERLAISMDKAVKIAMRNPVEEDSFGKPLNMFGTTGFGGFGETMLGSEKPMGPGNEEPMGMTGGSNYGNTYRNTHANPETAQKRKVVIANRAHRTFSANKKGTTQSSFHKSILTNKLRSSGNGESHESGQDGQSQHDQNYDQNFKSGAAQRQIVNSETMVKNGQSIVASIVTAGVKSPSYARKAIPSLTTQQMALFKGMKQIPAFHQKKNSVNIPTNTRTGFFQKKTVNQKNVNQRNVNQKNTLNQKNTQSPTIGTKGKKERPLSGVRTLKKSSVHFHTKVEELGESMGSLQIN